MTLLLKKVINIDKNSRSQTAMESVWSVSKLSTESVGSRRELVATCLHAADADATQFDWDWALVRLIRSWTPGEFSSLQSPDTLFLNPVHAVS